MANSTFTPTVLTIPSTGTTGSGTGEINVVTNPTASTDTSSWVATGLTASRDATGSPLDPVVPTGFSLSATASGQTFVSAALTVPTSLRNRKLKLEFAMSASTAGYKVDVLQSDGTTRFSLTTDVSGVSNLPSLTGKYVTYFDMDAGSTVKVRFTSTAGTVGVPVVVKFTQVIVGPGIQPQGAVVGEWVSSGAGTVGAVTTAPTKGTTTKDVMQYQRVGPSLHLRWDYIQTVAGVAGSGLYLISLPAGLTLDSSKIPASTAVDGSPRLGRIWISNGTISVQGEVYPYSSTQLAVRGLQDAVGYSSFASTSSFNFSNATLNISVYDVIIPIAEWAGSGTVQLAQNDVEYAWNSGNVTAANGTDTSSFGYGPSGTPILGYVSNAISNNYSTRFQVKFQTPIQTGDAVVLEINNTAGGNTWVPMSGTIFAAVAGTATYGASLNILNPTTVEVGFGNAGWVSTSTYGAAGSAWSSLVAAGYRWRVRKSSAGAAVGFGIVQPGVSSGLVSASGLPGNTSGSPIAAGYVGETIASTSSSNLLQGSPAINTYYYLTNAPQVTLSKGVWEIGYLGLIECGGTYSSSAYVSPTIQLYNTTGASQVQLNIGPISQGATTALGASISGNAAITITSDNTIIQMRIGVFNWTGASTTSSIRLRGDVTASSLYAVRIA